eukprot:gnl/Chilomastix_cuspidata/602.p1 GENE.gnl/Chilomastix_cuspidata/602~~gnl/Chilomastix_cuspidata/602.p1  ORF type:complete len:495 (-),score=165.28 gnl/Chilomastix_cuspidata/602:1293-2729(-)
MPRTFNRVSDIKFPDCDPLDPHRYLTQLEDGCSESNVVSLNHSLIGTEIDIDRLEEVVCKILEWYPVLGTKVVKDENGLRHFQPCPTVAPQFRFQLERHAPIRSFNHLMEVSNVCYNTFCADTMPTFEVFLFRVDRESEESRACPIFKGRIHYIISLKSAHHTLDGMSNVLICRLINSMMTDPSFKCPLTKPQLAPWNCVRLLKKDIEPAERFTDADIPGQTSIRWDFDNPQPLSERTLGLFGMLVPPKTITRVSGVPLTDAFAVGSLLCYFSLTLHEHPELELARSKYCIPSLFDKSYLEKREDRPEDPLFLIGSHIAPAVMLAEMRRDTPASELITKVSTDRAEERGGGIARRWASYGGEYVPNYDFLFNESLLGQVLSNVGRVQLPPGPLGQFFGCSIGKHQIGHVNVFPVGQADGSIVLIIGGLTSVYPKEFLLAYGRLWVATCRALAERDFTPADMFGWPEFAEALACLPPKE